MSKLTEKVGGCVQVKGAGNRMCGEVCENVSGCDKCNINEVFEKLYRYENADLIDRKKLLEVIDAKIHNCGSTSAGWYKCVFRPMVENMEGYN